MSNSVQQFDFKRQVFYLFIYLYSINTVMELEDDTNIPVLVLLS